jgi:hypothetical protein
MVTQTCVLQNVVDRQRKVRQAMHSARSLPNSHTVTQQEKQSVANSTA